MPRPGSGVSGDDRKRWVGEVLSGVRKLDGRRVAFAPLATRILFSPVACSTIIVAMPGSCQSFSLHEGRMVGRLHT